MVPAIIFAVITLGCVVIFLFTNVRLRAGRRAAAAGSAAEPATGQAEATAQ
jgi:hypothetical protein